MSRVRMAPEAEALLRRSKGLETLQVALAELAMENVPMPLVVHGPTGLCVLTSGADPFEAGEEAGRLAAIRAEVEREAEQLERLAKRALHYADMLVLLPTQAHPYQVAADRYAARAADCRRWLEATR